MTTNKLDIQAIRESIYNANTYVGAIDGKAYIMFERDTGDALLDEIEQLRNVRDAAVVMRNCSLWAHKGYLPELSQFDKALEGYDSTPKGGVPRCTPQPM